MNGWDCSAVTHVDSAFDTNPYNKDILSIFKLPSVLPTSDEVKTDLLRYRNEQEQLYPYIEDLGDGKRGTKLYYSFSNTLPAGSTIVRTERPSSESNDDPSDPKPDKKEDNDSSVISVTSVKLITENAFLLVGESLSLTASIEPSNATNKKVEWASSNTSVATVSDGIVTAVSAGKAIITAKSTDGRASASCVVTVSVPVSSVMLNVEKAYLNFGGNSLRLIAAVEPSDAINEVNWSSSNPKVATVSDSGVVSAISVGEATITATAINQDASASCIITVLAPGESAFTPRDKIVTPIEKNETVSASAVVAGASINVSVNTKYTNAITFTGKKITPDMLGVEIDTSTITEAVALKEGATIKPTDLIKVSYVSKNNINAGGENKAYFYGRITINKNAKKALSNSEYKKLQKLVNAVNTRLKDKNNTCKYTINPKSVTEC